MRTLGINLDDLTPSENEDHMLELAERELKLKVDELFGEAEELRDEAYELERSANRIQREIEELREGMTGVVRVAVWMLANLRLSPMEESYLGRIMEESYLGRMCDETCRVAVRAVAIWRGIPLPLQFYPPVPTRERVAKGRTLDDLPLFAKGGAA